MKTSSTAVALALLAFACEPAERPRGASPPAAEAKPKASAEERASGTPTKNASATPAENSAPRAPPTSPVILRPAPSASTVVPLHGAKALQAWGAVSPEPGLRVELTAQHPSNRIGEIGSIELRVVQGAATATVSEQQAIFGPFTGPMAKVENYDSSDVSLEHVTTRSEQHLVAVHLAAISGEDVRTVVFQTALWRITGSSPAKMARVWTGPGDEYHVFFDACTFGVQVEYRVTSPDTVIRHCEVVTKRTPEASRFADCASTPKFVPCADEPIVW